MIYTQHFAEELRLFRDKLPGSSLPVQLRGSDGSQLALELDVADQLGCAVTELRFTATVSPGTDRAALETWAQHLSGQLRYLLEPVQPLEYETNPPQAMLRSVPPEKTAAGTSYYEALLTTGDSSCQVVLKRYRYQRNETGQGRQVIPMQFTYETLQKLANDVAGSIPG